MSPRIRRRRSPYGVSSGCPRLGRMKALLQLERTGASLSIEKLQAVEQGD